MQIGASSYIGQFSYSAEPGFVYAVRYSYRVDLNSDGQDELVYAGFETQPNSPGAYSNTKVSIFGWVDGRFQDVTAKWLPGTNSYVQGVGDIAIGDFNNDGLKDLYLSGNADMDYEVQAYQLLNTGQTFIKSGIGFTKWEHGVTAADLDLDGYDDVVVAGYLFPVPLLRGSAQGLIPGLASHQWPDTQGYATNGSGVAAADFYGDGTISVIVADNGTIQDADTTLSRVFINAQGIATGFTEPVQLPEPLLGVKSHDVRARAFDFNDDGLSDVLIFSRETWNGQQWPINSRIQFLENQGSGNFVDVTSERLVGYSENSNAAYTPIFADFNFDGLTDIFLSESSFGVEHNSTAILLQSQGGKFIDTGRAALSARVVDNGGMASVVKGPDQAFYVVSEDQSPGGDSSLSIARLSFPERDLSETLRTTISADQIWGLGGNDTISASAGNDSVNGGNGIDAMVYQGTRDSYEIGINESGVTTVHKNVDGSQDALQEVERLVFDDQYCAIDLSGNAGQAYRLYKAAFDRTPDLKGLGFWISKLDQGSVTLEQISAQFISSKEFSTRYGSNVSDADFLTLLYENVLDRGPDDAGLAYWVRALNNGLSRAAVLMYYSESSENQNNVADLISGGIEYSPFMA